MPQAVIAVLDVQESGDRLSLKLLLNYLRPRQLLLVLDNFEHLLSPLRGLPFPISSAS